MNEPPRRTQRKTHLDASTVPVERALLARAALVQETGSHLPPGTVEGLVLLMFAAQLTELAEELHWWG